MIENTPKIIYVLGIHCPWVSFKFDSFYDRLTADTSQLLGKNKSLSQVLWDLYNREEHGLYLNHIHKTY